VLSAAFSAYHASDLRSGQIKKIKKEKEDRKKPSKPTSHRHNDRRGGFRSDLRTFPLMRIVAPRTFTSPMSAREVTVPSMPLARLVSAALSKKQKVNDRADVPSHVFMHEAYADVEFLDFTYIQ
jgi:hypothetical protein